MPFDLSALLTFSHTHCLTICAWLIPANLLASLQVLLFSAWERSGWQQIIIAIASSLYATLLALHVLSWYVVGIVRVPTFILLGLAILCWGILGAVSRYPTALPQVWQWAIARYQRLDTSLS